MSLSGALNTALTGLQVNQNLMRVTSSNISNANTEGYTRKTGELSAIYLNDIGSGVQIEDVRRVVDNYLVTQINQQTSRVSAASGLDEFYTRLQDLFGTPADNSSISGKLNTLRTALEQLAIDPQQSVNQFTAVTDAVDIANSFNNISDTLQSFRGEVDKQISIGVDTVNGLLTDIEQLNTDIARNTALGNPVGDLYDKRDLALHKIAEQIDIKWFTRPSGAVTIMTGANYTLLDESPHLINFSSPTGVSKSTTYPGGFDAIEVPDVSPDITTSIKSGRIKSMIDMRDSILTGLQDQIDQLATQFSNEINRAHSSAMPIPGLKTMTGNTSYTTADLLDPTNPASVALNPYTDPKTGVTEYGSLQFAIIDSSGNAVGDALRVNLDEFKSQMEAYVTASTGTPFTYQVTLGDVINMINGAYAATPPTGTPVPPQPAGWPGGVTWPPAPALVMPSSGSDIAGLTNLSGAGVTGDFVGGTFASMVNGNLVIKLPESSPYGLAVDDNDSTFTQAGTTTPATFNYLTGINNLFIVDKTAESSGENIHVRADIASDPSKIGRSYLTSIERTPGDPTTEEWYVGRGDGGGATAMANVFTQALLFSSQGSLPAAKQTISEYAASIVQLNARGAANASTDVEFQTNLKTELTTREGQVSGVNIDEELAKLITIQNAYSASARIVTTVNSMYDDLLSLIR